jgi:hypothetical protein
MRYSNEIAEITAEDEGYWTGVFGILAGLADFATGIVLALLGAKLYSKNFIASLTRNKVLAIFLLLWAASFFFWGLYDITDWAKFAAESAEAALVTIAGLFELAAAAILAMLGWKTWAQKETT